MEAFAVTLTVAAAVIPAAALVVHAIAQLPRIPLVEASVIGILTAVAAVTLAELGADPLPSWAIALSMIAWLVFLLIFPSGRPTSAALTVAVVAASGVIAGGEWWEPLRMAVPYAFVLAFAAVSAGQIQRYVRRSSIAERQSTKWLVLGLLPAIGVFLGLGIISLLPAAPPTMLEQPWYLTASTTAMWIVPIAATAGILLDDRGPIDELIRFAIAATGTAFVAAAAYVAALGLTRPEWAAATACATVVPAAWLFLQLGTALAYSRGPQRPLAAMPARLGSAAEPRDVGRVVAETTHASLGLPVVEVRVGGELLARVGDDLPSVARTEVVFDGARVAELVVAPRRGESELTRRDRLILDRIATAAAPALRAAFAAREADEARTHLETARADERRRLHADLHDELGPALAGLGFTARAASRTLDGDRPEVERMLGSIESGTQSLVRRVREISYDLRPEELAGERLEAILEDRLRTADDSLRVRLDCDPVPDDLLPDILRIVLEAVTNVRRHAAARSCQVTVRADEPHRVRIDVTDDGNGTGPAATEGIGHASIRRRAEQHGGWVEFVSSTGGSRLTAVLGAAEARSA